MDFDFIPEEDVREMNAALEGGDLCKATERLRESLKEIEKATLNIAITGQSGTGKSSFVNAIRGMSDEEEGSAETGVVETTMKPTPYTHPQYPNVTIWDLPGIGTPNFAAVNYLECVEFHRYDFFIIISSERFKQYDIDLAKEIQAMDKKFYFVRSKVDNDLHASQVRKKKTYNEENVLKEIRDNCIKNLNDGGIDEPRVFLLSLLELDKYDFYKLQETVDKELPTHKRQIFLDSLPNISLPILEKKCEALRKEIWKWSLVFSALPVRYTVPNFFDCDLTILVTAMIRIQKAFGLDNRSLEKLANNSGKDVSELKSVVKSPLDINTELLATLLTRSHARTLKTAYYVASFIPVLGTICQVCTLFGITYSMLCDFLEEMAEDAARVLRKALE